MSPQTFFGVSDNIPLRGTRTLTVACSMNLSAPLEFYLSDNLGYHDLTNKRIKQQFERPMRLRPMLWSESEQDNRSFAVTR